MKNKSLLIGAVFPVLVFILCAAVPSLTDFNLNQFDVTTRKVALRNGVLTTNLVEQTAFTVLGSPSGTNSFGGETNAFLRDVGIGGTNLVMGPGVVAAIDPAVDGYFKPVYAMSVVQSNGPSSWISRRGSLVDVDNTVETFIGEQGSASGATNIYSLWLLAAYGSANNSSIVAEVQNRDQTIPVESDYAQMRFDPGNGSPIPWIFTDDTAPDSSKGFFIGPTFSDLTTIQIGIRANGSISAGSTNQWKFLGLTVDGGVTNAHCNVNGTNFLWALTPE